jgi:hypothetical protein
MYQPEFVAGVLAGFENALDALLEDVPAELRDELDDLNSRVRQARMRIYPVPVASEAPE